jgi:hypothetical protein
MEEPLSKFAKRAGLAAEMNGWITAGLGRLIRSAAWSSTRYGCFGKILAEEKIFEERKNCTGYITRFNRVVYKAAESCFFPLS